MDPSAERARSRMYHLACHLEQKGPAAQSGISALECSSTIGTRRDARVWYGRVGTNDRGPFMRPAEPKPVPDVQEPQPKCSNVSCDGAKDEKPVFEIKSSEAPLFARSISKTDTHIHIKSSTENTASMEWSPRMDVVESGLEHIVTIELPGINADNIHVEINHGKLMVTGSRSWEWYMLPGSLVTMVNHKKNNDDNKVYCYRRELSYGPYRAVWTLPKNANSGGATAELTDGFLRVFIPKTKACE